MTRRWCRTTGGKRLHNAVPAGRWRTLTLLGAVSVSGWVATMTIEAPTDGDVFLAYLEHVLCPQLRPTHYVVLDNLAAHKVAGVRELIEATGARWLYLPPYSPGFNPIENGWTQVKQHLRAAKARDRRLFWSKPSPQHSAPSPPTRPRPVFTIVVILYRNRESAPGAKGILPAASADNETMRRTLRKVMDTWQ